MSGLIPAKHNPFAAANVVAGATITIGAEGAQVANKIRATIQLLDNRGQDLSVRGSIQAYLSDDANGDSLITTAPNGTNGIATDGLAIPIVAGKHWRLISEADGDIDIYFEDSGALTCYLILILPDGSLVASSVITFGA